jgi:tRNA1Val (adenine37-N6)-methyltransferase
MPGQEGRLSFPSGLKQPAQGYRFSVDALLLACFVQPRPGQRLLDLGAGCGVVGLGILLQNPDMKLLAVGIDADPEMVGLAEQNGRELGLADRSSAMCLDVGSIRTDSRIWPESFDQVVTNPPYRAAEQGRPCSDECKHRARFETEASFADFAAGAAYALKNRSRFALVHLAEKCLSVTETLRRHRLEPKRMRFVHGRKDSPAKLVLLEAVKNGRVGVAVEPPLFLYDQDRSQNRVHPDAAEFCPFLLAG